jgi:nitrogen regulatory protein P-II 1
MKEISLFIRPEMLEKVKVILVDQFHSGGMTVSNVLGCGSQKGFNEEFIGVRTHINLLPKLKIEVAVRDEDVEAIINRLCDEIATGHVGDGKIFIKPITDAVRIRTRERGDSAL